MTEAILTMHLIRRGCTPGSAVNKFLGSGGALGARESIERIREELAGVASGALDGKLIVRVDGSAGVARVATITVTAADCTAGDRLDIVLPGMPAVTLTAVAGAATAADGEYSLQTATDTAVAQSIVAAINADSLLSLHVVATESSSGVVSMTFRVAGTWANAAVLAKTVGTSTALVIAGTDGVDPGARPSALCTFGAADIVNDNTVSVGGVTFTWKASAASQDEITSSAAEATAAAAFAAAVNAHTNLQGLVSAAAKVAEVQVTWLGDPRTARLVTLSRVETNGGSVTWSAAYFTPLTTESYGGTAPRVYALGAP